MGEIKTQYIAAGKMVWSYFNTGKRQVDVADKKSPETKVNVAAVFPLRPRKQ